MTRINTEVKGERIMQVWDRRRGANAAAENAENAGERGELRVTRRREDREAGVSRFIEVEKGRPLNPPETDDPGKFGDPESRGPRNRYSTLRAFASSR